MTGQFVDLSSNTFQAGDVVSSMEPSHFLLNGDRILLESLLGTSSLAFFRHILTDDSLSANAPGNTLERKNLAHSDRSVLHHSFHP